MKDPKIRYLVGSANRGKKFSLQRIKNMYIPIYSEPHTEETKKKIGKKSSEKWTPSYKKKFKRKMVELGYWKSIDEIEEYRLYHKLSYWTGNMFNTCSENERKIMIEYGIFHPVNNSGGVSRDHRFSIKEGFINKVYPEIIRHPCNCEIMLQSDNSKKHSK